MLDKMDMKDYKAVFNSFLDGKIFRTEYIPIKACDQELHVLINSEEEGSAWSSRYIIICTVCHYRSYRLNYHFDIVSRYDTTAQEKIKFFNSFEICDNSAEAWHEILSVCHNSSDKNGSGHSWWFQPNGTMAAQWPHPEVVRSALICLWCGTQTLKKTSDNFLDEYDFFERLADTYTIKDRITLEKVIVARKNTKNFLRETPKQ